MAVYVNETPENCYDLRPLFVGFAVSNRRAVRIRSEYIFHYILKGRGAFLLNGKEYSVHAGEMFVIKPNDNASYYPQADGVWEYVWIGFEGAYAERLNRLDSPVIRMRAEPFGEMSAAAETGTGTNDFYLSKLYEIFAELFPQKQNKRKINDYPKLARNYIELYYADGITIEQIAAEIHVDKCYLSRCYRKRYGQTIKSSITALRMKKAVELLQYGNSVKNTAEMLGYNSESAFFAAFNGYFGTTPMKYINGAKKS